LVEGPNFQLARVAPITSLFVGMIWLIFALPGCGGVKCSAMIKAARSELSLMAQAQDDLNKLCLPKALAAALE
jgi:hypothetical protein